MPSVVVAISTWVVNTFTITTAASLASGAYAAAVATVSSFIYASLKVAAFITLDYALREEVNIPEISMQKDVTSRGTTEPKRIVYGEALVSGPVTYNNAAGGDNEDLYTVIPMAGHEIEDITDMWLDGDVIADADIDWTGTNKVTSGKFNAYTSFYPHFGSVSQTHDTTLAAAFADWTSAHDGKGIAYIMSIFQLVEASQLMWESGAPRNIKALVKGKKDIYDPRLEFAAVGTYGVDPGNAAYQAWTENPVLCLTNYMTDTNLGMSIPTTRFNWEDIATEADYCEETVAIPTASTETRFTCNGVLLTTVSYRQNIIILLSAFNGRMSYHQGKYIIQAGRYIAPTLTITEDWLRGDVVVKTAPPKSNRYNTIRPFIVSPENNYKVTQAPIVSVAAYVSRDNGEGLFREEQLSLTNSSFMAQRIAYKILYQSDEQQTVILPCNYKALQVAIHEQVQVTLDEFSWSSKVFRCVGWKFADLPNEGGIDLILKEDQSSAYDDPVEGDYSTISAAGVVTFNSPGVPTPSSLTATAVEAGIVLNFTLPERSNMWDTIQIYRSNSNSFGAASLIAEVRANTYLDRLDAGETRYYWIYAVFHGTQSTREPSGSTTTATATAGTGLGDAAGTANWSEVVDDDANKPDNNADVTNANTANDTDNVNSIPAANVTNPYPNLIKNPTNRFNNGYWDMQGLWERLEEEDGFGFQIETITTDTDINEIYNNADFISIYEASDNT